MQRNCVKFLPRSNAEVAGDSPSPDSESISLATFYKTKCGGSRGLAGRADPLLSWAGAGGRVKGVSRSRAAGRRGGVRSSGPRRKGSRRRRRGLFLWGWRLPHLAIVIAPDPALPVAHTSSSSSRLSACARSGLVCPGPASTPRAALLGARLPGKVQDAAGCPSSASLGLGRRGYGVGAVSFLL